LGTLFFFLGGYINLAIGAIMTQISSIVDGCDGEIARLKFAATDFGGWFDAVLDRYADAFLLFGLTFHVSFPNKNILIPFIFGFLAIIGTFLNSYTADKYDGLMEKKLGPRKSYFRVGRDIRMFLIFLGGITNQPLLTLVLIASLTNVENIRRIVILYNQNYSPLRRSRMDSSGKRHEGY
jgi:CDP-L-myo-inositol myo-inositolphosphotransferase